MESIIINRTKESGNYSFSEFRNFINDTSKDFPEFTIVCQSSYIRSNKIYIKLRKV